MHGILACIGRILIDFVFIKWWPATAGQINLEESVRLHSKHIDILMLPTNVKLCCDYVLIYRMHLLHQYNSAKRWRWSDSVIHVNYTKLFIILLKYASVGRMVIAGYTDFLCYIYGWRLLRLVYITQIQCLAISHTIYFFALVYFLRFALIFISKVCKV